LTPEVITKIIAEFGIKFLDGILRGILGVIKTGGGGMLDCAVVLTHMVLTTVYLQIYVREGASYPHPRTEFQGSY
jgi:hypothetical protein